jgi:hypothetical protein
MQLFSYFKNKNLSMNHDHSDSIGQVSTFLQNNKNLSMNHDHSDSIGQVPCPASGRIVGLPGSLALRHSWIAVEKIALGSAKGVDLFFAARATSTRLAQLQGPFSRWPAHDFPKDDGNSDDFLLTKTIGKVIIGM